MNNNINLLGHKDHEVIQPASGKLKLLRALAVVSLFGVSAAAIILFILISFSALPQAQQQEQQALQALAASHADMTKIALVQDRLAGISTVLTKRNKYDVFLDSLVSKMPSEVSIQQVSISKKNATITVKSTTLQALNIFLGQLIEAARSKKEYTQVTLNSINSDDTNPEFSMTISFVLP